MGKTWRQHYAPLISKEIQRMKGCGMTVKEMKKELSKMNPGYYGHARKIFANEYMIQLGLSRRAKVSKTNNQPKLF